MKKRVMIDANQIVQVWRMAYMERKTFVFIAEKLGLTQGACYGAYKIVQQYIRGDVKDKKRYNSYLVAARTIKGIIKNEIEAPKTPPVDVVPASVPQPPDQDTAPVDPYTILATAMKNLEAAVEGVIAYNAKVERERITKIMEEAKYSNWSESLRKKFVGE